MENEREELTRKYFPRLHHACNACGIQFVPVDMRWGITSEAAANAQVINICLREIDRSDVFIGFFGQRYGWHGESDDLLQRNFDNAVGRYPWLADYRDRSVTELEFLHGHLLHPSQLPASLCFRDKAYDDAMKDKAEAEGDLKSALKYTAESEHSMKLMADLIERVKATESQVMILCFFEQQWKYSGLLFQGAKFMFESVWKYCQELLATSDSEETSLLQQNRLCHDAYLASRTTLYLGGDSYLQKLSPVKMKEHPNVLVHGPAGCGKSALLANLVKQLQDSENQVNFIYHFVGCAQGTTDPKSIMQRILAELQFINGTEVNRDLGAEHKQSVIDKVYNNEFHDIYVNVQNEMQHASSDGKQVVIIIDGLNRVTASSKTAKHLYWLPEKFPCGISLIVSCVTSNTETFDLLVNQRKFYDLEVQSLPGDIKTEICKKTLLVNGKELSPQQLQRVVKAEQTQNPLFLKIVLSEISIYGYFRFLDKKIDSLIYSNGVKDLLSKVLQRLEEDYNVQDHAELLVQQVLSAIAVSHQGLSETELLDMFHIESHVWSPFYFAVEFFLINDAGLLRYVSIHISF
ncbi:unnamed protein product [Candidula unifasciata]|uniref:AAA+ ATPase domain-containing protein n=1 Tax=Candidula unifasciata TaxID=100452 RepID=A0A8S3YIH1_9EUPU|nr:unnamed protein product [Candidula unifasciata]